MQISLGAYRILRGYKLYLYSYKYFYKQTSQSYIRFQRRIQGRDRPPPPLLLLDQNEAQRAKHKLLGDRALPFFKGLDERPPPYLKVWIRHWILVFYHYKLCLIRGIQQTKRLTFVVRFY